MGYCSKDLILLNDVHKFQNILHLSNTSNCNGITLDDFVISDRTERSSLHVFHMMNQHPPIFVFGGMQFTICAQALQLYQPF
jgi:hypothetical protein